LFLPDEEVQAGEWTAALSGAFDFLWEVSGGVRPTTETVDDNLLRFCDFVEYTAEVHNGGHGQYLDNCRPSLATLEKLHDTIARLDMPDYTAIGADFVQAVRILPPGKSHTDGSFTGCELLDPLDKRYFTLWYADPIERYMVRYLAKQPWVRLSSEEKIAASAQAIRRLRQAKRRVTMPSADEVVRFVGLTARLFGPRTGRK
jgi:hypothetical protein